MAEQEIRYCTASDGVRIAYATAGSGPPLVKAANWIGHLEFEWRSPVWRHWLEAFTADHLVVRYDERGNGLSDRNVQDCSFEAWVRDLETVVDTVGLDRFALFGWSQGAAVSVAYAVRHPERVSHIIALGGFAGGFARPGRMSAEQVEEYQALMTLTKVGWGRDDPTYRQIWTNLMLPDATPEQARWLTDLSRVSVSPENAVRYMEEFGRIDVIDLLAKVQAPTLVVHARDERGIPFEFGRELAAGIPGARMLVLDSRNHFLMENDPAWPVFLDEVRRFLGTRQAGERQPERGTPAAAPPIATVLFTDMEGSTSLTQRLGDAAAQEVVRAHNAIVRDALSLHGGVEIKHTGDGIMASFPSASRALECAVEIQSAVAHQDAHQPAAALRLRIGVNAGEPLTEDGDLFGTAVQLARRICDRAEPGEILVANVVRELAAGKGFLFSDGGEFVPKGFDDLVRVFELRWQEED